MQFAMSPKGIGQRDIEWIVFADSASSGNPGPGGWGAIAINMETQQIQELGGGSPHTTNNRMELIAVLETLRFIHRHGHSQSPCKPKTLIYTDSTYVIQGNHPMGSWKEMGGKQARVKTCLNRDLWEELTVAAQALGPDQVKWTYVPGHSGIFGNERADEIAVRFSKKQARLFLRFAQGLSRARDSGRKNRRNNVSSKSST